MAELRDHYEVLGVSRDASDKEIKDAWRRTARKYHPDRNPGDSAAERKIQEINAAYEVLSDDEKRGLYDRFGHAGPQAGGPFAGGANHFGMDLGDVLGGIFGDAFGGARREEALDLRHEAVISLEQAVRGAELELAVDRMAACETCEGSGAAPGSAPSVCAACNGSGTHRRREGFFSVQETCMQCGGRGRVIRSPCSGCRGQGRARKQERLKVTVPVGVDDGNMLRLTGKGHFAGPNTPGGDLYVRFHVRPHPVFERDGNDLHANVPIRFATAALGGEIEVPTLDGRAVAKVAPGTTSGQWIRLRGKGAPSLRQPRAGDLLCQVLVEIPVELSRAQKKLLRAFDDSLKPANSPRATQAREAW